MKTTTPQLSRPLKPANPAPQRLEIRADGRAVGVLNYAPAEAHHIAALEGRIAAALLGAYKNGYKQGLRQHV